MTKKYNSKIEEECSTAADKLRKSVITPPVLELCVFCGNHKLNCSGCAVQKDVNFVFNPYIYNLSHKGVDEKYVKWIHENVSKDRLYGRCIEMAHEMFKVFPELQLWGGEFITSDGSHNHVWLQTKEGVVVDPTIMQFYRPGFFTSQYSYEGREVK